ncbi:MAG: DUF971 domain-containing protein [Burkholderiales bacterium]|nr:DUF971 domain-containing protein [Burkholderiales bacterium]
MITPTNINFHNKSKVLDIEFPDAKYSLTYEFLRVFSPSADVRGHAPGEEKLQVGKRDVTIDKVDPMGEYGLRLTFSDGHDSGIYTWEWLEDLGNRKDELWASYLEDLKAAGASRDPDDPNNEPYKDKPKPTCPSQQK